MKNDNRHCVGMKVFVRHQDVTKEIINLCNLTKPNENCRGIQVPIPSDPNLLKYDQFHGGWAMITGYN